MQVTIHTRCCQPCPPCPTKPEPEEERWGEPGGGDLFAGTAVGILGGAGLGVLAREVAGATGDWGMAGALVGGALIASAACSGNGRQVGGGLFLGAAAGIFGGLAGALATQSHLGFCAGAGLATLGALWAWSSAVPAQG